MSFDLEAVLEGLVSDAPDAFPHERAIRLFQLQTWTYFSYNFRMVDAAGQLAAAAFLRKIEQEVVEKIPVMGGGNDISSKNLIKLLKTREYSGLYNEFFRDGGWTGLLRTVSPEQFNKLVAERRRTVETVSEMIDFRFRALDHKTLDPQQSNISRSEFYRWYEHPTGTLSWRTIRSRWKDNRDSAPFLYVSERFASIGFPRFDPERPTATILGGVPDQQALKKILGMSLYVAEKIDASVLSDFPALKDIAVRRLRPKTTPHAANDLAKMKFYKEKRDQMRNS